ncbi:hypothetical protein Ctob_010810 [Chrysochromulina tobinii]|uniref:Uncharacterized protein n=1 Tax=Chrysochromulina tobinii TaxID=1460289 RepID=A0A0M0J9U4_9EUKA|nr:hypothetical protein Ctob_010810 [Chrysochromulina tobinii]|eukprot:KOO23122.1 hypothetical protein Ctob_010810 [Chrysochromulina sp. CCMP291]
MSSPRMSSPHMTSQRMSPNISSPRIVANLTDVNAKLSTTIGEGLCSAVAGKGACFIVYGTDTEGRPVLSVGYLASVLVVSLIGPAQVDSQRFESLTDGSVRVWYTAKRYFRGRIAFAPSSAQPGYSSESPDVRNAQFGAPPDTRPVFANVAEEQSSIDLRFGGAVEAGGAGAGTLLYATFCVPRAGTYLAHITLDQQHVVGSPLVLRVAPCAACAHRSEVRGAAQTQALAGRHEICTVWLRDAFGNARRAMDAPAAGPLTATLELLSAPETTPETPGQFADEYYGAHDGDGWAAHADSWTGGGLGRGGSNTCSSARLRVGSGQRAGSTLAAAASAAVTLKPDGSFAVGYTIRRAGIWALSLMLGDEPIGRSPYAVERCVLLQSGARGLLLRSPETTPNEYSVRALTEDGAAREGAAATTREGGTGTGTESTRRSSTLSSARHVSASKAAATSPSKAWTPLRASSAAPSHPGGAASGGAAGGGVLIVRLFRAGDHLVRARLGALELPGSPVRLRVEPAKVSAKHCYIAHDAASALRAGHTPLDPNFGLSGVLRVSALTLLTADKYANPVRHGGAGVTAKLSGPGACSTTVEDHLDGSYTISWSAVLSGVYRVSVLVDGAHCAGSPFAVQASSS